MCYYFKNIVRIFCFMEEWWARHICAPSLINLSIKWPPLYFTVFLVSYPSTFLRNKCKNIPRAIFAILSKLRVRSMQGPLFFSETRKSILQHVKTDNLTHELFNIRQIWEFTLKFLLSFWPFLQKNAFGCWFGSADQ